MRFPHRLALPQSRQPCAVGASHRRCAPLAAAKVSGET